MKVTSFKIYPSASKWYYTVHIFARRDSMYRYRASLKGASKMRVHKYLAITSAFNSPEEEFQYGEILFTRHSGARSGIVAHELCHALTYWWKHMERPWVDIQNSGSADERHALLMGNMVNQYWKQWWSTKTLDV